MKRVNLHADVGMVNQVYTKGQPAKVALPPFPIQFPRAKQGSENWCQDAVAVHQVHLSLPRLLHDVPLCNNKSQEHIIYWRVPYTQHSQHSDEQPPHGLSFSHISGSGTHTTGI